MRPARLLAPLALVATAVALYLVVISDRKDASGDSGRATPTVTSTTGKKKAKSVKHKRYIVRSGDTPSGIAAKLHVTVGDLLDANPSADPNGLRPGQRLRVP